MVANGCRFAPDDLTPDEWQGLSDLRHAQNDLWQLDRQEKGNK